MGYPQTQSAKTAEGESPLRIPPHSIEYERALLGALLLDGGAFPRISDLVQRESFYRPVHAIIFAAMKALDEHSEPIDLVTVSEELKRQEKLEKIGGMVYLTELAETLPTTANIEHYARLVHEKYMLRRVIELGNISSAEAYGNAARADEVFEKLQVSLVNLIGERRGRHSVDAAQAMKDTMGYVEHLKTQEGFLTGVGSGFHLLDDYTTGFSPGDFVIIAARPSMGKTSLAMNIARAAAGQYECTVAVFSLEMELRQLALRMLASEAHIELRRLRTSARLKSEELARLSMAAGRLAELPVYFDDTPGLDISALRARARQIWIEHKVGMIIIDYLQLITPPRMADNQQQWIAYVSASLKSLAKELKIPIICLSQLSRAPETRGGDRRPMLSDLRDSGAIEQDADMVLFVYRPSLYKDQIKTSKYEVAGREYDIEGLAEIIIAKNRNGPTGSVPLTFVDKYTMFASITDEAPPVEGASYSEEESLEDQPF